MTAEPAQEREGAHDDGKAPVAADHRSTSIDQAAGACAEGDAAGLSARFPMRAEHLKEIVFRPGWLARADRGKVRVPPVRSRAGSVAGG